MAPEAQVESIVIGHVDHFRDPHAMLRLSLGFPDVALTWQSVEPDPVEWDFMKQEVPSAREDTPKQQHPFIPRRVKSNGKSMRFAVPL